MEFLRIKSLDDILANAEKKPLKRQLDAFHLIMLGIGAVIGTGIFVLTSVAADKAGPGMLYSFIISGIVCMLTALIYAEIASMVPVSGFSSPRMRPNKVDLPAPLGPIRPRRSVRAMKSETSEKSSRVP
jgi:amino acid permease